MIALSYSQTEPFIVRHSDYNGPEPGYIRIPNPRSCRLQQYLRHELDLLGRRDAGEERSPAFDVQTRSRSLSPSSANANAESSSHQKAA